MRTNAARLTRSTRAALRVLVTVAIAAVGVSVVDSSPAGADVGACSPDTGTHVPGAGYTFRRCGVPDFDQRRDELPVNGKMYCVPASALNWMAYLADRGLPFLDPGPGLTHPDIDDAEDTLISQSMAAMGMAMQTDPDDGTGGDDAADGLVSWLAQNGLPPFAVGVHWLFPEEVDSATELSPSVEDIVATAAQGSLTMLNLGWWDEDSSNQYSRDGGHVVSLVGAERDPEGLWNDYRLFVNDPASVLADPGGIDHQSLYWTDQYTTSPVLAEFKDEDDTDYQASVKAVLDGSDLAVIDGAFFITPIFGLFQDPATAGWHFSFPVAPDDGVELVEVGSMPDIVDAELAPFGAEHLAVFESGDIDVINGVDGSRSPFVHVPGAQRARFDDRNRVVVLARGQLLRFLDDGTPDPATRIPVPTDSDEIAYDPSQGLVVGWDRETGALLSYDDDLNLVDRQVLPPLVDPDDPETPVSLSIRPSDGTVGLLADGSATLMVVSSGVEGRSVQEVRLGSGAPLAGLVADSSGVFYSTHNDDGTIVAFDESGEPVEGTPFHGMTAGRLLRIWQPINIGDPPQGRNVLPEETSRTATTTTVTTEPEPSTVGDDVTVTAQVTAALGATVPTGQIIFTDGFTTLGFGVLDPNGIATLVTPGLAPGVHSIGARYQGDLVHDPSKGATTHTVERIRTRLNAHPALLQVAPLAVTLQLAATLTDASGTPLAGQPVRFVVGGTTTCTGITDATGRAVCNRSALVLLRALLALGYDAVYDGDATHAPSTDHAPILR